MTTDPLPSGTSLWRLIEQRAERTPARTMFVDDRDRTITFGGFRDACLRAAAWLHQAYGVGAGSVVSWQLPTCVEALVISGALSRLGATQNPIITMLREAEVGHIVEQNATQLLIVPGTFRGYDHAAMATRLASRTPFAVHVVEHESAAPGRLAVPDGDVGALPEFGHEDGAAWIYYTSGTTALPKGIRHTDASLIYSSTGFVEVLGLSEDDVYPIAFPIAHVGGMSNLTAQLRTGALLALTDVFSPTESPVFMARVGATLLGAAVPFFHAYIDAQRAAGPQPLFPHLRACLNGGAPKTVQLHEDVKAVLGGLGIIGAYGLTELPIAAFGSPHDTDAELGHTDGRVVPGVDVRIVGVDGSDLPQGDDGEIRLRGPQMFQGYVDPALDADAIDEQGYLRTGDIGHVGPHGHLSITGRIKDIIIRNAENLSALEIEQALIRHAAIADVAVVGVPDARTGERACAVVVVAAGHAPPTLDDLAEHCRALGLAAQKIPERLVVVAELPRNSLGKVQKNELRRDVQPLLPHDTKETTTP